MINKIEHIGIAVKNLKESSIIYEKILGTKSYKKEEVDTEKHKIELNPHQATDEEIKLFDCIKTI